MKIGELLAGLPEGVYRVSLAKAEIKQSQSGNPMYELTWDVVDGPYTGQQVRDWLVLTGAGAQRWAKLYLALGGSENDEVSTVSELAERCLAKLRNGAIVYAEVKHKGNGIPRPFIQAYYDRKQGEVLAAQYARRDSMVPF